MICLAAHLGFGGQKYLLSGCQDVLIEFESCDNIIISFIIYWTTCYRYSAQRKLEIVEGSSQVDGLCDSYLIQQPHTNTFHWSLLISCLKCRLIIPHFPLLARRHSTVTSDPCEDRGPTDWWWREVTWAVSRHGSARRWRSIHWTGLWLSLIMLYNSTSSLDNWS